MDGRVALWHVWVELRDNRLFKLDVAWMSQEALMPPEARPKLVQLVDQLPPGVVHLEGDTQVGCGGLCGAAAGQGGKMGEQGCTGGFGSTVDCSLALFLQ